MQSERTSVRYPHTWEANLLVALVSILAFAGGAVVTVGELILRLSPQLSSP